MKKLILLLLLAVPCFAQNPGNCTNGPFATTVNLGLPLPAYNQCFYGTQGYNIGFGKLDLLFPSGVLSQANGGTGTATPGLVAGTNISITGTWPNQTINATGGGGATTWGAIVGTLSNQTDLQNALNLKANLVGPSFTAPNLGTPSAATLTNATGLSLATGIVGVLGLSNGGTGTASPGLVQGSCMIITGTFPNQTIAKSGAAGCGTGGGGSYATLKVMSGYANAQAALDDINAGDTMMVDGTYSLCNGTISTSNFRLIGSGFQSGVLQCGTASAPVITLTGNGWQMEALTVKHTVSPTSGGDGVIVGQGTTGVHVSNNLIQLNYNGLTLGATSFGVVEGNYIQNNNADGVHFSPNASIPVMQWELVANLSQKNLGDCFDMTLPGSFNGVHNTGPTMLGNQAYGCAGKGYRFDAGSSTASGISDVFMGAGNFSSTTNDDGFYLNNGSNGGRNNVFVGGFSELSGQYSGGAGFSNTAQTPTNVGYGINITSACDATQPPIISGILLWENSYSGIITGCPGTTLNNISAFKSGMALNANSYNRAGVAIRATNVSVMGGYMRNSGGTQIYGVDVSNSADTPNVMGVVCDSSTTTCINSTTNPANGYQSYVGNRRMIVGSGAPGMACSNGDQYRRSDAGNFSTFYACRNAAWIAVN